MPSRPPAYPELEPLARWLDSQFTIPGTRWRFGLDPLIGLIPGLGSGLAMLIQLYLVLVVLQRGGSGELLARMTINVLVDSLFGAIPVLGQLWDFYFKASQRNLRLARAFAQEGKYQGNGLAIWLGLLILLLGVVALLVFLVGALVGWFAEHLVELLAGLTA
jgi:hypothetical protein